MLEKEKLFSKFNVNDYNKKLEEVLEGKHFSEEAENLLLNMFYKIEASYKDYELVKCDCMNEKDFIFNLIDIIEKECNEIIIVKPRIGEELQKYVIDKRNSRIQVFPNEFSLMYALYRLGTNIPNKSAEVNFISICLLDILGNGEAMNNSEVIRDFTGWAWDIVVNEIDNIECNILYQNMIFLFGKSFITDNLKEPQISSVLEEKFIFLYGKEQGKIAIKKMQQFLIAIYSNTDLYHKRNVLKQIRKIELKLEKLQNKNEFIENIAIENSKNRKKIKKVNRILSSIETIREEFIKENNILDDNNKIFSISNFVEKLESDREKAIKEIAENNNLINPLNYSKKLLDVKNELKKYNEIKIKKDTNANVEKFLIEFQKIFFEGMSNKIKNANTKKELITLIYEFRYYNFLPYKNGVKLKYDTRLEEKWEEICTELIEKLLDNNVIDVMAENGLVNYDIVKYIFQTKMIKIENLNIKMTKHENKLEIEYYDVNMLEDKSQIEIENAQVLHIKSERRVKLFL